MATFYTRGHRYTASLELIAPTIPHQSVDELASNLEYLAKIEEEFEAGLVVVAPDDWREIVAIAKALADELVWRSFFRSVGIYMEVR